MLIRRKSEGDEIRTRDCLVSKTLIPCQKPSQPKSLKLFGEASREHYILISNSC